MISKHTARMAVLLLLVLLLPMPCAWPASIEAALTDPGRLPADLDRDKRSRPEAILPLLSLDPGDRVVDIFGSGGYYSELIASIVGEHGEVLLHNNRGFGAWGINILQDRFNDRSIPNLVQHTREIVDLDLGTNRLDAALLVMAYHDLYVIPSRYNGEEYVPTGQPADVRHFMEQLYRAMKPGARFVVIDHAAGKMTSPASALELHRIHESFARSEIERFGFHFLRASNALRNPADDHSMIVFDSAIKGNTDRFVLVFEKPGEKPGTENGG